ncbi:MAG: S41 family peptidase [Synergistaceae bacterium]|nr:S41 family peptidase [Synergistaceae bacterium]
MSLRGLCSRAGGLVIGVIIGAVVAGGLFTAGATDLGEFAKVSPFNVRSMWLMKQARSIVETYQVDSGTKEVKEEDLLYGAVKGMVAAWGDPYTRFVEPAQLAEEEIEMEGRYGGLGIYIGQRDGKTLVISPIEDTPADRAGLKPNDQIVKIGDDIILGWDSQRVVKELRGEPGVVVTIWVRREGEEELLEFAIEREIIKIKSARWEMMEGDLGYLKLTHFKQNTAEEFGAGLEELIEEGAKGLILDLRNNGGGLLNGAMEISDMFLDGGTVVVISGKVASINDEVLASPGTVTDLPMVVLINEGSASASEIVAGALVDRGRALSVGKKTFGKGSVQTLFNLGDDCGLYVTIARYRTPSGRIIDHEGLEPDIEVEGEVAKDVEDDEQLKRAKSELRDLISGKAVTAPRPKVASDDQ